jgi:hypothetical protein
MYFIIYKTLIRRTADLDQDMYHENFSMFLASVCKIACRNEREIVGEVSVLN